MRRLKKDRPKWQQCLTVKEIRHIEDIAKCRTLKTFVKTVQWQNHEQSKDGFVLCFDCKAIASKLIENGVIEASEIA